MEYSLALDIGIASVGWAVVDENREILELGSNLFPEANPANNVERRTNREGRRLKRRQKTRITDFEKLWKNYGFEEPVSDPDLLIEVRVKGLREEITLDELFFVLRSALKHRGISYLEDALESEETVGNDYKKGLLENQNALKNKFPCEIQYERYKKYGEYRGNINVVEDNGEKIILSNVFTVGAYKNELKKILETQKNYNDKVTDEFINKYMEIFLRKREYYVGPGNELSRTDYGRYTTKLDENGNYITEENIFEKLIGKCSVYKDELRASGASYTAQEYNLLNDLCTYTVNGRKLTKEEKIDIVKTVKESNTVNMRKIISQVIGEKIDSLTGVRIDKNDKEIFFKFEQYKKMKKELEEVDYDIDDLKKEEIDAIADVLTLNTEHDAIINALKKKNIPLSEEAMEKMVSLRRSNGSLFSKWQSFSLKIMNEIIPAMYEEPKNQMQVLTDMGIFKNKGEKMKGLSKIPYKEVIEEIYNPVVVRSVRVAVQITNAVIKKYGTLKRIVIEMPRDSNGEEQKKRIKDLQRNNENEWSLVEKEVEKHGIKLTDVDFKQNDKLSMKLKLWYEQNGTCPYSGKKINVDDLINNNNLFEIDHIIPKSISFDDSRNNKVLVYSTENQKKGNETPFHYLNNIGRDWDYIKYKSFVLQNYKDKKYKKKKENLLFEEDITKIEVLKGFINRNINDTRYASRVILNTFQDYFKANEKDTKVKVIKGSFTHQMRVKFKLKKDRDEDNSHHAIDAVLICYSNMGYEAYRDELETGIDFETGEIIDQDKYDKFTSERSYDELMYQNRLHSMKKNIALAKEKVKYWYMVDKKVNRGLCNQTIRGGREYNGKIYKINKYNIYSDTDVKNMIKKIKSGKQDTILMYRNDRQTYDDMINIIDNYKDATNPFKEYEKETGDYFRKYSKKHNGPRVNSVKYTDGEVNSCIDISHKYGFERGSKRVFLEQLNPYRADVFYDEKNNHYYIVGIKYSDIKCEGKNYVISEERYEEILRSENVISEGEHLSDMNLKGIVYKFSLYKNDFIEYEKNGDNNLERFLSRTMPKKMNYIETKPIEASKFEKQNRVGLNKTKRIRKFNVDILGNKYLVETEKFSLIIDGIR